MNRVCGIFSRLLQLFSRGEFKQPLLSIKPRVHVRGYTCWGQVVAMFFASWATPTLARGLSRLGGLGRQAQTSGGIPGGLPLHLGLCQSASSLAVVSIFLELLGRCQEGGRRKFRFKNKLLSLDATVSDLCASLYHGAKFRRTKRAIKLHLLVDHHGYLPRFAVITDGKTHELKVGRKLRWEPGTMSLTVATLITNGLCS